MSSFYDKAVGGLPEGHSSYFESPHDHLDPNLFEGDHLIPDVRERLLAMLDAGLVRYLGVRGAEAWLRVWLAGSGITYQWEGGEGDLDVLFGVDMPKFYHWNPEYMGIPEAGLAEWADTTLKRKMWPKTVHTRFGQRTYEATFYWNAGTGDGIDAIKPYAAYDLRADAWVVRPPSLPADPRALYPTEWYQAAGRDVEAAETIIRRHDSAKTKLASTSPESPDGRNAGAELVRARAAAKALFDEIHLNRKQAFAPGGNGYADWHNFRWQHGKETGVIPALRTLTEQAHAANMVEETRLYGGPIQPADQIILRDMMRYGKRP